MVRQSCKFGQLRTSTPTIIAVTGGSSPTSSSQGAGNLFFNPHTPSVATSLENGCVLRTVIPTVAAPKHVTLDSRDEQSTVARVLDSAQTVTGRGPLDLTALLDRLSQSNGESPSRKSVAVRSNALQIVADAVGSPAASKPLSAAAADDEKPAPPQVSNCHPHSRDARGQSLDDQLQVLRIQEEVAMPVRILAAILGVRYSNACVYFCLHRCRCLEQFHVFKLPLIFSCST